MTLGLNQLGSIISIKKNVDSVCFALLGSVLIFTITHYHGVGISPDSVTYFGVAQNISNGKGLIEFNENPLIIFPAGYPLFLGIISKLIGLPILQSSLYINACLFGATIFLTGCIIENFTYKNHWYKWSLLSILPISYALLDIYSMLWSETLFLVLLSCFILSFNHFLKYPTIKRLFLPTIATAIICDTRIAGISVLATGLFLILFSRSSINWVNRIYNFIFFAVGGFSVLFINLIRNTYVSGTMTGIRQKSITPILLNIQYLGETFLQWAQFSNSRSIINLVYGFLVILFLIFFALYIYFSKKHYNSLELVNVVFASLYILFILFTASISKYEKVNNRLLSPAFIPLLLSISYFLAIILKELGNVIGRKAIIYINLLLWSVFQYAQVRFVFDFHNQSKESGIPGYTETSWDESDIVQYLKNKPLPFNPEFDIFSNACDAVYFYNKIPAYTLPEKAHFKETIEYYNEEPNYIIWFTNEFDNKAIIRLESIKQYRRIDTLMKFNDGLFLWSEKRKQ